MTSGGVSGKQPLQHELTKQTAGTENSIIQNNTFKQQQLTALQSLSNMHRVRIRYISHTISWASSETCGMNLYANRIAHLDKEASNDDGLVTRIAQLYMTVMLSSL